MPMRVAVPTMRVRVAVAKVLLWQVVTREDLHQDDIHQDAEEGHAEHERPFDNLRLDQPQHGLIDEDARHHPHDHDAHEGAKHLGAVVSKRVLVARDALR